MDNNISLEEWENYWHDPPENPDDYFEEYLPSYGDLPLKVLNIASNYGYVKTNEMRAINWVGYKIQYPAIELINLIGGIRKKGAISYYKKHLEPKKDGTFREINEPSGELKLVQREIIDGLLLDLPISENAFGFSGGNIVDAITPHLNSSSFMMVDIKNAFPSIKFDHIINALVYRGSTKKEFEHQTKLYELMGFEQEDVSYFSWYTARVICQLCTLRGIFPQGAPTSPRLFDLVFKKIDDSINSLIASKSNKFSDCIYTRYADNLLISSKKDVRKIKRHILESIEGSWRKNFKLEWHKLKINDSLPSALRVLGLNIIEGKLHNTRKFKRRLRLMAHHLLWLKDHNYNYDSERKKFMGMLGFTIKETLPENLQKQIKFIKENF